MKTRLLIACAVLLCTAGCREQAKPVDPIAQMGLTETALGHTLIEHAANLANDWLDPAINIHFVPSWSASGSNAGGDPVKIYAISEFHAPANYMVAVPVGCRCVLVEPHVYQSWLKEHMSTSGIQLDVNQERLLAFMFLHEAGHIVNHDPGDFDEGGHSALNLDQTAEKNREEKADAFAVAQLKGAMGRRNRTNAWTEAQMATMDLGNLSFEMQEVRSMKYFGAATLHTPAAYYDTSYTHPNFELRILTVNDMISNTPTSHQLLENFLEGRSSDAKPGVLFQAPSLTQ